MQKYFVDKIENNQCIITNDDYKHISKVMRGRINDEIILVCNQVFYLTKITHIDAKQVVVDVISELNINNEMPVNVTIAQALIKKDNFDLMLKKATELGVKNILPIQFSRSIVKISEKDTKIDRWNKITKEAAEQSIRSIIPEVAKPAKLKEIDFSNYDAIFVAYEKDKDISLKTELNNLTQNQNVLLVIGPEGGITTDEIKFLKTKGAKVVGLGPRILRSETASMYFLSALSFTMEHK